MRIRIRSALATAVHAYGIYAPATPRGADVDVDAGTVAALEGDARVIVKALQDGPPAEAPPAAARPSPATKRPRKP